MEVKYAYSFISYDTFLSVFLPGVAYYTYFSSCPFSWSFICLEAYQMNLIEGVAMFFKLAWDFINGIPFFTLGISFGQFFLGIAGVSVAISLLAKVFDGGSGGSD